VCVQGGPDRSKRGDRGAVALGAQNLTFTLPASGLVGSTVVLATSASLGFAPASRLTANEIAEAHDYLGLDRRRVGKAPFR